MMLIEQYELNGIQVISANTDGVTIKIRKDLIPLMHDINKQWEETTQYILERTDYQKIIFSTVNDYIAITPDGYIKKKGDFLTDFELHKNKSARIVPLALEQYYVNGTPVRETITQHTNLFDFCIRKKASKDFYFEGIHTTTSECTEYNKLIRYYVSRTGEKIFKVRKQESTSKAVKRSQAEAGDWVCTVCNYLPDNTDLGNVNYTYYIHKAERMISKIQSGGKRIKTKVSPNQLDLFS